MPHADIEATRAAAQRLGEGADALATGRADVSVAPVTQQLAGSRTADLLAPVQTQARLRISDAGQELSTLDTALDTLADNVAAATGESP
jgi:hypothetical protein